MEYTSINTLTPIGIDYHNVEGTFPATYSDTTSYETYPVSGGSSVGEEVNNFNTTSYDTTSIPTETYNTNLVSNSYQVDNTYGTSSIPDSGFASITKIETQSIPFTNTFENNNENFIDSDNIVETTGYQESDQTNEIIDNNILSTPVEYADTNTPVEYDTTPVPAEYNEYNVSSTPVEYNTTPVTEEYNEYNASSTPVEYDTTNTYTDTNYYEATTNNYENTDGLFTPNESTSNNIISYSNYDIQNTSTDYPQYSTYSYNPSSSNYVDSTFNTGSTNIPNYPPSSVPVDISSGVIEDPDTEIIPVEEIEYVPVKKKKYIKRKKVKVVKTVVIPKKIVVPVPVKKTIYVPGKKKIIYELPKVKKVKKNPIPKGPVMPIIKRIGHSSSVPVYHSNLYRTTI